MTDQPHIVIDHPQWRGRNVSLICGAPGSGKSTLARQLHANVLELEMFDHIDGHREQLKMFGRQAYRIGRQASPNVAVVRGAPTLTDRAHHERLCRPSRTIVLLTDPDTSLARVSARGGDQTKVLAAVRKWWAEYEPSLSVTQREGQGVTREW